ncbi:MAG TPA: oligosaccharide flippase family protein [Solirubrobacteraceae bacterium]|nr:oligosaccharide flippase family protein [Solirubrobacteraceae bacterium]
MLDTSKDAGAMLEPGDPAGAGTAGRYIDTGGATMRSYAARGVLLNGAFDVGLALLGLARGIILAALLTRSAYGVWGILVVSLGVLARLKYVGVSDKYVQQDDADQEVAFQKAFTVELMMTGAALVPMIAALPVIAVIYGHWELVLPGLVLLTTLAADALQAPLWIYYRQMHFARQRLLGAIEPVVGFVVAVVLAIAGLGYWALAIGVVVGAWAGAAVALATCPFRLRWRYDRGALRVYASFSGPIFVATASGVVLANGAVIATNSHLGLAGVGVLALTANITALTARLDAMISGTLYPAICAIQDRVELLRESFVKSNRLALMWGVPFGAAVSIFAGDLIRFIVGERWHAGIGLLEITGIIAAASQIGFNWDDYFMARSETVPIAVVNVAAAIATLGVGIPLLLTHGLTGLAVGMAAGTTVDLALRAWYLSRLFAGFALVRHALRAILPTIPAVAIVLLIRLAETGPRTAVMAVAEVVVYALVTVVATWVLEKPLLREAAGYLSNRSR